MKITIVLGAFFPVPPLMGGAVEKVWFALGQEFARRGHEVVQISRSHSELPAAEEIEGVRHVRVRGHAQPRSILWLKWLDLLYSLRVRRILPSADILVTRPRLCAHPARTERASPFSSFPIVYLSEHPWRTWTIKKINRQMIGKIQIRTNCHLVFRYISDVIWP
jgi:hypothetical protein